MCFGNFLPMFGFLWYVVGGAGGVCVVVLVYACGHHHTRGNVQYTYIGIWGRLGIFIHIYVLRNVSVNGIDAPMLMFRGDVVA